MLNLDYAFNNDLHIYCLSMHTVFINADLLYIDSNYQSQPFDKHI